jgi:hypothetical protein
MALINKKFDKKEDTTSFKLESNGKVIARLLTAKLDRDDWEIIQNLIQFTYNQGFEAGSENRASDIRTALG